MKEEGQVKSVKKNFAVVSVSKKDECSKCGMCLFQNGADSVDFNAENSLGAKVGDKVIIQTAETTKFLGIMLVFLVPLILIGISALINYLLIKNEIWILILSVILIVLWYTILALIDKKLAKTKKFATRIVEIIKEKNADE